jgi:hypothetical protein
MTEWNEVPGPRAIGTAITRAVDAARAGDADAYETAVADVAAQPATATGAVLGALVRTLLEEQHPDGLDGDDIQAVLARCYGTTIGWLPPERIDIPTLVAVVAGALGIHEPGVTYEEITGPPGRTRTGDDWAGDPEGGQVVGGGTDEPVPSRVPTAAGYARHAPLLLADLLAAGARRLGPYLDAVFAEIAREESMEFP